MKKFVRALIVAAACLTTAWWLLREAPEQERLSMSKPIESGALPTPAVKPRANPAALDDALAADVASAARRA